MDGCDGTTTVLFTPMRKQLQILVVTVALAALAGASGALGATTLKTKNAAYLSARSCLLQVGATRVGRRPDGGGFVFFKGLRMDWTYKTSNGLVTGASYVAPSNLFVLAYRKLFVACVTKGI
jgi:hypothetical protein